jgi:hypothetical protein
MHTFSYFDEDENEYEVNFDYDPYLFEEEDPSQSPWHYITILEVRNFNNEIVEFDDDKLYEISEYLWDEYKREF